MSFKSLAALSVLLVGWGSAQTGWISPEYTNLFEFPLPIPPLKEPVLSVTNGTRVIDYFEIDILPFEAQIYPNLPATPLVGYDGMAPGPTFRMTRGREAVVRFRNSAENTTPSAIHLHGSFSRAPWDGWAADLVQPGEFKDYYYPNAQPERTLWYHDHAERITAPNANGGQAGFYILDDPEQDFGFPAGDYDIPLMLSSRRFNADGTVNHSTAGDVITVNAQPWPYLNVEPRKYRFRLLDASMARTFQLSLAVDETSESIPFTIIASDSAYLSRSIVTEDVVLAMAERWDVIIDFEQFAGQNITLQNNGAFDGQTAYPETNRVMRFVVGSDVTDSTNNGAVPAELQELPPPETPIPQSREFNFTFDGAQFLINGVGFGDVENRILATPQLSNVERWILRNPTNIIHPVHIHLVDFRIVSRVSLDGSPVRDVTDYELAGLKDIAYLEPQSEVEILANFAPWPGLYMFHCHNLLHEDNDMMAAFNVTITPEQLEELGYGPEALLDPESPEFAAQPFVSPTDIDEIRDVVIPGFFALNAYPELARISSAEWVDAESPEAAEAPEGFGAPPEPQLKRATVFRA